MIIICPGLTLAADFWIKWGRSSSLLGLNAKLYQKLCRPSHDFSDGIYFEFQDKPS
jgi:hypothetical protein